MSQNGLYKKRRGVGSIIAGAFIILIILSSYEFYLLNNRAQNDYQKTLTNMRSFDIARTQEDLKFTDFAEDYSFVEVRNDGPELVHVMYIAIFVDGVNEDDPYDPMDVYIEPGLVEEITLPYILEEDEEYFIQIITERGNVFPIFYPQDIIDYPYVVIISGAMAEVVGDILPQYDSFKWANRLPETVTEPFESAWDQSWTVQRVSKQYTIFKVSASYYGDNDLPLDKNTGLYFNPIDGSPQSSQFYLVKYDEDTDSISQYDDELDPIIIPKMEDPEYPPKLELYFAVKDPGEDPSVENQLAEFSPGGSFKYQTILGLYQKDGGYAQAFSLIAVEVI